MNNIWSSFIMVFYLYDVGIFKFRITGNPEFYFIYSNVHIHTDIKDLCMVSVLLS